MNATLSNSGALALKKEKKGYGIVGKKPGEAFLKFGSQLPIKVIVYSSKMESAKKSSQKIVDESTALTLELSPQKMKIMGTVETAAEWIEVSKLLRKYPKWIEWEPHASAEVISPGRR